MVKPAHRGSRFGLLLIDALCKLEPLCSLTLVLPGILSSSDGKLDVAGHKAALLGQLRYFQSGGFRRLGRSKFLARASDPADASRRAPVEDYYEEAYGAGKEVAAETSEAIIDEEIARATAAGLTGNALLLAWRSRARERELATMPQSTREKELAEVARLRARYPAVCTQSEADGAPVFMLIGAPDWFYKMSAARISARSSGGSGTSPGIGGGSTVPRQW